MRCRKTSKIKWRSEEDGGNFRPSNTAKSKKRRSDNRWQGSHGKQPLLRQWGLCEKKCMDCITNQFNIFLLDGNRRLHVQKARLCYPTYFHGRIQQFTTTHSPHTHPHARTHARTHACTCTFAQSVWCPGWKVVLLSWCSWHKQLMR